jgi:hypothetical protein
MAEKEKTLYDVLGVRNSAKPTDIKRAYDRIISDMEKETSAPDPRLRAQAKVAFDTLFNADQRDDYDALLRRRAMTGQSARTRPYIIGGGAVLVIAIIGFGYSMWHSHALEEAAKPKPMQGEQLLQSVTPLLWHASGAMMSGEVRELGTAIATAEGKLALPCQGLVAGMIITVKAGEFSNTAELASPNEAVGVCVLKAKGALPGLKPRNDVPRSDEALEAIFMNATGRAESRKVSGAQRATEPSGPALEVKAAVPLPNGAGIFDSFGRLAGIVVAPHPASEGSAFAMSPLRLAMAKGVGADKEYVEPPPPARNVEPVTPPAASESTAPSGRRYKTREEAEAAHRNAMEEELNKAK